MERRGKVAVVTGAASGIGLAVARLLGAEGMKLVLADVSREQLDGAVAELREAGHEAIGIETDVADLSSVCRLADAAYETHGVVHLLHLNAGVASGASLFDLDPDPWTRVVGVNLMGVIWGIKAFAQRMVDGQEDGYIVATSSGAGAEGTSYETAGYAATKMAVLSVMECLHGQLRDRGARLRAGVLFPPLTATHLAGAPEYMGAVESMLRSKGVPATLVQPDRVAALLLDGIARDRFFIRVGARESREIFDSAITDDYLDWNARMIRGRADATLADATPESYLW